jgi:hypothetical protein
LYKIDDFGSFFELTADMSFPPGGWSAITLGGGRSILLSYRNKFNIRLLSYYGGAEFAIDFCERARQAGHAARRNGSARLCCGAFSRSRKNVKKIQKIRATGLK